MRTEPGKNYLLTFGAAFLAFVVSVFGWFLGALYLGKLPPPAISDSVSFNEKALWLNGRIGQGCDVLAIGSSMSLNNLHSVTIRDAFPAQRYVNAASWGMSLEQSAQNLRTLLEFCTPERVILATTIRSFEQDNRRWVYREDVLKDLWQGSNIILTHLRTFSLNYYTNNAGSIARLRNIRSEYASLAFDGGGGVPLQAEGFRISGKRWRASPAAATFVPADTQYEALARIAEMVRQRGARLIVLQAPIRQAVIDRQQETLLDRHWRRLDALAAAQDFRFINLGTSRDFADDDFVDSTHLNEDGARRFTAQVIDCLRGVRTCHGDKALVQP